MRSVRKYASPSRTTASGLPPERALHGRSPPGRRSCGARSGWAEGLTPGGTSRSSFRSADVDAGPLRVIIADDHALFRQGLKSMFKLQPEVSVTAEVDCVSDLLPA